LYSRYRFIADGTAVAILGLLSYSPILNDPDYVTDGPTKHDHIVLGALFELLTAAAVAGTALAFYPVLKKHAESITLGYVTFRLLEARADHRRGDQHVDDSGASSGRRPGSATDRGVPASGR
jgi:hypothetical protein